MTGTDRPPTRRPRGTGSLFTRRGSWYGQWWIGGRQVKRRLGAVRMPGARDGITRTEAERRLRRAMEVVKPPPARGSVTVEGACEQHIEALRLLGRRETTLQDYGCLLRRHIGPSLGDRAVDRVGVDDIAVLAADMLRRGYAASTVHHVLNLLSGMFRRAVRRGWAPTNPVALVERPPAGGANPDIRYLTSAEIEALVRAVPDDYLGPTDRVLYLTAAMTGMRQGELCGLRWRDADWSAGVIRVRRTFTRGRWGTPKSRRSSRAVPMADRLAGELDRHYQRSAYQADDDLVFAHPHTGRPYDASRMRKRFKEALARAGVGYFRFHDLRHTFGTAMASAGAPMRAVQEWMGHTDQRTTLIYADYAPDSTGGRTWAERAFRPPPDEVGTAAPVSADGPFGES